MLDTVLVSVVRKSFGVNSRSGTYEQARCSPAGQLRSCATKYRCVDRSGALSFRARGPSPQDGSGREVVHCESDLLREQGV